MDEKVNNIGFFEFMGQPRLDAKERALPNGNWKAGPLAGEVLIAHQDYMLHREPSLRYQFKDIVSFGEYCDVNIKKGVGIIFYTNTGLVGFHNRYMPTGNRVQYDFEFSPELMAWKGVICYSHKAFRQFLEERLDELVDTTIFETLATLKMNTSIHFESDFEDNRNYGFTYEEKEGKGSSKIPKELTIKVPFFANDSPQEISLRLDIPQPKDPESKALFTIEIIRGERLLADNVTKLIMNLRKALPNHMILHGEI